MVVLVRDAGFSGRPWWRGEKLGCRRTAFWCSVVVGFGPGWSAWGRRRRPRSGVVVCSCGICFPGSGAGRAWRVSPADAAQQSRSISPEVVVLAAHDALWQGAHLAPWFRFEDDGSISALLHRWFGVSKSRGRRRCFPDSLFVLLYVYKFVMYLYFDMNISCFLKKKYRMYCVARLYCTLEHNKSSEYKQ